MRIATDVYGGKSCLIMGWDRQQVNNQPTYWTYAKGYPHIIQIYPIEWSMGQHPTFRSWWCENNMTVETILMCMFEAGILERDYTR